MKPKSMSKKSKSDAETGGGLTLAALGEHFAKMETPALDPTQAIWPNFSRICFRERLGYRYVTGVFNALIFLTPVSIFLFILCLLSKSFSGSLPHPSGATSIPNQLIPESVFWPALTLKPYPAFHRCYHLVQRCLNCSANHPGLRPSC